MRDTFDPNILDSVRYVAKKLLEINETTLSYYNNSKYILQVKYKLIPLLNYVHL